MEDLAGSRRRLVVDSAGIAVSGLAFGAVYGIAARNAGFSAIEAVAMSTLVFGGAAQFAAVGYVSQGMAWPLIIALTAILNARHLLYGAILLPWLREFTRKVRALVAYFLTDEVFALGLAHFERIGRVDLVGYWIVAVAIDFVPWNIGTVAGVLLGGAIPDPSLVGLDIVFAASMAGLTVGMIGGRKELVAVFAGVLSAVGVSIVLGVGVGIVVGGLVGPSVALVLFGFGSSPGPSSEMPRRESPR